MDPSNFDIFEDSSKDLQKSKTCLVCAPEKYPCVPCGKLGAVEEKDEKIKKEEDDRMAERKLKDISLKDPGSDSPQLCGKPVVLKVSGLFDDGVSKKKPTVTVTAKSSATKPGVPPDPDHDIFVLRIGKKGLVGVGEKSDIQLEMKTPKGLERGAPIRYETRDVQTDKNGEALKKPKKEIKKDKKEIKKDKKEIKKDKKKENKEDKKKEIKKDKKMKTKKKK